MLITFNWLLFASYSVCVSVSPRLLSPGRSLASLPVLYMPFPLLIFILDPSRSCFLIDDLSFEVKAHLPVHDRFSCFVQVLVTFPVYCMWMAKQSNHLPRLIPFQEKNRLDSLAMNTFYAASFICGNKQSSQLKTWDKKKLRTTDNFRWTIV